MNWRDKSACRGKDPDIFYSGLARKQRDAKKICLPCPVKDQCLGLAMEKEVEAPHLRFGIFGGLTADERKALAEQWGERCLNGHFSDRREADGRCLQCVQCELDDLKRSRRRKRQQMQPARDSKAEQQYLERLNRTETMFDLRMAGLTYQEIADRLGVSCNTVHRALRNGIPLQELGAS